MLIIDVMKSNNVGRCSKAGIYPGSSSREFVVCTAGDALGTQLVQTKHNCSVNMVYRNHQCVPTLIMPYVSTESNQPC